MPPSDWLLYLQTWMWVDPFMRLVFHSDTLLRQTQVHRPCVRSLHGFLLCTPPGSCYEQAISLHTRRTFPWVEYPWWLANSELFLNTCPGIDSELNLAWSIPWTAHYRIDVRYSMVGPSRRFWTGKNERKFFAQPRQRMFLLFHVCFLLKISLYNHSTTFLKISSSM